MAWAAGLYEGEGSVGIYGVGSGRTRRARMSIGMVDRDVVERFHSIVKVGRVLKKKATQPNRQDVWRWEIGRREEIVDLLNQMMPVLGTRRTKQAKVVIKEIESLLTSRKKIEEKVSPPCGFQSNGPTLAGKNAHVRKGEPPCESCRDLARRYHREWSRSKRSQTRR